MVDKQSRKRLVGDSEALQLHCLQSRPGGKCRNEKKKLQREREREEEEETMMRPQCLTACHNG